MSQHDYDIANASGATVRADINSVLDAIASNNSGATAPSTTFANQWWYDTSTTDLKQRNNANTAWISVARKDGSGWTPYRQGTLLGDAAEATIGTSGDTVPKNNTANTYSEDQEVQETTTTGRKQWRAFNDDGGAEVVLRARGSASTGTSFGVSRAGLMEIIAARALGSAAPLAVGTFNNDDVTLGTGNTAALKISGSNQGIYSPGATGASQGVDTINASAFYDDGVLISASGIVKGWAFLSESGGTYTLEDNFNVSGFLDNGVGDITVQWDTDFANANYAAVSEGDDTGAFTSGTTGSKLVGSYDVRIVDAGGSGADSGFSIIAIGDQ